MKLWIRAGDGDDYNAHDDVQSAGEYLATMGAVPGLERCNEYGLEGDGFRGQNYISAYWGDDLDAGESAERGLTDDEIAEINKAIAG